MRNRIILSAPTSIAYELTTDLESGEVFERDEWSEIFAMPICGQKRMM